MSYFVTIKGKEIASNLSKIDAINRAISEHEKNPSLGGLEIGVGKYKTINNILSYKLHPYYFYL